MINYAIILVSGTGSRTGLKIPKQFVKISGKTILEYSVSAFEKNKNIDRIIVVSNPLYIDLTKNIIQKSGFKKVMNVLEGGETRQQSSYIGINSIKDTNAKVLIHDGVRPFISQKIINNCIEALNFYKAVNVAVESSDTIFEINDKNIIKNIPERKFLKRCQTPQCFDINIIKSAHELAVKDSLYNFSDDCGLVLKYNLSDIYVVDGSMYNIKITYPIDIEIAEIIADKLKKEEII